MSFHKYSDSDVISMLNNRLSTTIHHHTFKLLIFMKHLHSLA